MGFVYRLTRAGRKALEESERSNGKPDRTNPEGP
jgi:hypothetical protein